MADLSTVFPQMAQSEGFQSGLWQADQNAIAQQNARLNQRGALQQMFRDQQMLPLDMANKQATTDQANANAYHQRGLGANSFYDLDVKERLKEPTYLKALSTMAADTSENEVKQMHASLEKDMLSPNPAVRDAAQKRYKVSGDMLKMYEDLRVKGENSARVATIGAQSRTEVASMRPASGSGAAKPPATMEAQYNDYFRKSQDPEATEAERAHSAQLADTIMKNIIAKGNAKAPAMVIGPTGTAVPNTTTTPGTIVPTPTAGKPQHSLVQLKSMYPGKSETELKAAYKAKFGVDLQ